MVRVVRLNRLDFAHGLWAGAAATSNPPNDPLSLQLTDFSRDLNVNTVSPFVAAQQAVAGFAQLPATASKTFIYTGNILNTAIIPPLLDLGVGKSATAHIIRSAAAAYKDRGYKYAQAICLISHRLTVVDSIMPTSAMLMAALCIMQSTGMRTPSCFSSLPTERCKDRGSRHLFRVLVMPTSEPLEFCTLDSKVEALRIVWLR